MIIQADILIKPILINLTPAFAKPMKHQRPSHHFGCQTNSYSEKVYMLAAGLNTIETPAEDHRGRNPWAGENRLVHAVQPIHRGSQHRSAYWRNQQGPGDEIVEETPTEGVPTKDGNTFGSLRKDLGSADNIGHRGGTILIFGSDPDSDSRIGTFFQDRRFDPDSDSGIESVSGSDSNRIFPILAILAIDSGNFELVKKNL